MTKRTILKKIFFSVLIFFGACFLFGFAYVKFIYEAEMNDIEDSLNKIDKVKVINIWGHQDVTLEEISARVKIAGKGELVLYDISSYKFSYPKSVNIHEIGNYSFTWFSCDGGIGPGIDIGTESPLGKMCGVNFKTPKDVINNYDLILKVIKQLKVSPELNHFETEDNEFYLLVENKVTEDKDPIFNLVGIENEFEFAKTLKWNRDDCYYNN